MSEFDEDVFKVALHKDEAFEGFWDKFGSEEILENLLRLDKKLSTQIAVFGDEREDWFKRVNALRAVIRSRIDQVRNDVIEELEEWQELVEEIVVRIRDRFDKCDYELPDFDDVDAIRIFLANIGL